MHDSEVIYISVTCVREKNYLRLCGCTSQLHLRWCHVGSLHSTTVGGFTPQRVANINYKADFFFLNLESQSLNIYQNITVKACHNGKSGQLLLRRAKGNPSLPTVPGEPLKSGSLKPRGRLHNIQEAKCQAALRDTHGCGSISGPPLGFQQKWWYPPKSISQTWGQEFPNEPF